MCVYRDMVPGTQLTQQANRILASLSLIMYAVQTLQPLRLLQPFTGPKRGCPYFFLLLKFP